MGMNSLAKLVRTWRSSLLFLSFEATETKSYISSSIVYSCSEMMSFISRKLEGWLFSVSKKDAL
jgi:hypothetical protein